MKCKVRLWLLFLLFEIATSNGKAQSTTPRYNIHAGNIVITQTLELNHTKLSNYTYYSRKLKRRQHSVKVVHGNSTFPNYVRLKIESKNNTNPNNKFVVNQPLSTKLPQKITQTLSNNGKNSLVNRRVKLKPKIRIKSTTRAPKVTLRPLRSKKKTVIRNSSNHYKNYTKFRIKSSVEKQNPMPEITLFSPEYPIEGATGIDSVVVDGALSTESSPFGVPVSQVLLQSIPINSGSVGNNCPTFQLSSYVYGPQVKQNCPDLNVVVNSQLSQNTITERVPEVQADPAVEEQVVDPVVQDPVADSVAFDQVPANAAAAPAASETNSGAGAPGPGGNPIGFPEFPGLPELPDLPKLPDLKGLFDFLGQIWNILSKVFGFLANPYLYLVPAGISFAIGFLSVLSLIPWWAIPVAFFVARKDEGKPEVVHYKHVHPPIHHYDEWFWNQNTKTWTSIYDYDEKGVIREPTAQKLIRVKVVDDDH